MKAKQQNAIGTGWIKHLKFVHCRFRHRCSAVTTQCQEAALQHPVHIKDLRG